MLILGYVRYNVHVPHHGTSAHYEHCVTKQVDNIIT
jgi:hypothetical protein